MNGKRAQLGLPWGTQREASESSTRQASRVWHFGDRDRSVLARQERARPLPARAQPRVVKAEVAHDHRRRLGALSESLPAHIRLGTVGYRYPQWGALVFDGEKSAEEIAQTGLTDYARSPLFRAIGLPSHTLVPNEREWLWEMLELGERCTPVMMLNPGLSTPVFPRRQLLDADNGFASDAGHFNPNFLDPRVFRDEVFPALEGVRSMVDDTLIVTLTLPPLLRESGIPPYPLLWRLERLATVAPAGIRLAIELRESDYFTDDYRSFLREAGWLHVVSTWPGAPPVCEQWAIGDEELPRLVRLAAPRPKTPAFGYAHDGALHRPLPEVRRALACALRRDTRETFVLASNAFEGCAPLSLELLATEVVERA